MQMPRSLGLPLDFGGERLMYIGFGVGEKEKGGDGGPLSPLDWMVARSSRANVALVQNFWMTF